MSAQPSNEDRMRFALEQIKRWDHGEHEIDCDEGIGSERCVPCLVAMGLGGEPCNPIEVPPPGEPSIVSRILQRARPLPPKPTAEREYDQDAHGKVVRKAVGNFRDMVWGSMVYSCTARCDYEHRILLGVGVEGPPALKEAGYTIPSPFICGRCPRCGGLMQHDRWDEDEEGEPRELTEEEHSKPRFVIPGKATLKTNAKQGYYGADFLPGEAEAEGT